ncbi:MAG: hypothetical protein NTU79_00050 [Planctomycetota bacterium]|nr:hypothetical protein [Planctomycetota bacterium]
MRRFVTAVSLLVAASLTSLAFCQDHRSELEGKRGKFLTLSIGAQGVAGPLRILDDAAKTLQSWETNQIEWEYYGIEQGGVAFDSTRERIYIATRNGIAALGYDGQLLDKTSGRVGARIAVDGKGNIWGFESVDRMWFKNLLILTPDFKEQKRIEVNARDLCFSSKDNSIWLAGENVAKVSSDGNIIAQIDLPILNVRQPISMITPDLKWGGCALVEWSNIIGSSNCRLHRINSEATSVKTTKLGSLIPVSMAIADGDVWLSAIEVGGINPTTFLIDNEGKIVDRSAGCNYSFRLDQNSDSVWALEKDGFVRLSAKSGIIQVVESIPCVNHGAAFFWAY